MTIVPKVTQPIPILIFPYQFPFGLMIIPINFYEMLFSSKWGIITIVVCSHSKWLCWKFQDIRAQQAMGSIIQ
jgi:hypothetical protein